jgi:hypothetical protein
MKQINIWNLLGVAYEYVQTERGTPNAFPFLAFEKKCYFSAQHAHEIITNLEDDKWSTIDGFISVGGDGLFNEVRRSLVADV